MSDIDSLVISSASLGDFSSSFSKVFQALPAEMGKRLKDVLGYYVARYGIEGAYNRISNRSVSQIFAEYQPEDLKPIASGEVDGVRYALYEAPCDESVERKRTGETP
jgi:hypothetical protein